MIDVTAAAASSSSRQQPAHIYTQLCSLRIFDQKFALWLLIFRPRAQMDRVVVKKGLKTLAGEGEAVLEMIADGCQTKIAWAQALEGPLERACGVGNTVLVTKLVLARARVTHRSFSAAATSRR